VISHSAGSVSGSSVSSPMIVFPVTAMRALPRPGEAMR
jgi:hypothetical protein